MECASGKCAEPVGPKAYWLGGMKFCSARCAARTLGDGTRKIPADHLGMMAGGLAALAVLVVGLAIGLFVHFIGWPWLLGIVAASVAMGGVVYACRDI